MPSSIPPAWRAPEPTSSRSTHSGAWDVPTRSQRSPHFWCLTTPRSPPGPRSQWTAAIRPGAIMALPRSWAFRALRPKSSPPRPRDERRASPGSGRRGPLAEGFEGPVGVRVERELGADDLEHALIGADDEGGPLVLAQDGDRSLDAELVGHR